MLGPGAPDERFGDVEEPSSEVAHPRRKSRDFPKMFHDSRDTFGLIALLSLGDEIVIPQGPIR